MALLALHFSKVYKNKILNEGKRNTMVNYPLVINPGQKLPIYISNEKEEIKSKNAEKIGLAVITKTLIIAIKDISDVDAKVMKHENKEDIIKSLKKWYKIDNDTIITYLEFKFSH